MPNEYKELEEAINTTINVNGLLILLSAKGIIKTDEFVAAKETALKELKLEYPQLFKD